MFEKQAHRETWNKFRRGEKDALSELYEQHYLGLINYGRMIVEDRDFVNDCFVELLIKLWEKRLALPNVENVRSYLITSLRRTILDRLEADKKRLSKDNELQTMVPDHQISYEEYLLRGQANETLKARIEIAMKKLTERQLELIRLKFFEDLSYDEISDRCNITKRTAYNIIHDGISILKKELSEDENSSFIINTSVITVVLSTMFAESIF